MENVNPDKKEENINVVKFMERDNDSNIFAFNQNKNKINKIFLLLPIIYIKKKVSIYSYIIKIINLFKDMNKADKALDEDEK